MYLPGKVNFSSSSHPIWLSLPCPVYGIILPLIENYLSLETQTSVNILQNFFNVNLCVHFVSMCLKDLKNGHRLTLKSLFIQPPCCINNRGIFYPPQPAENFFWSQMNNNKTFLLRCYGTVFAPIKRYLSILFYWLFFKRHKLSFYDLSTQNLHFLGVKSIISKFTPIFISLPHF